MAVHLAVVFAVLDDGDDSIVFDQASKSHCPVISGGTGLLRCTFMHMMLPTMATESPESICATFRPVYRNIPDE